MRCASGKDEMMKRYYRERHRILREHQFHLRMAHGWPAKPVDCICDLQAGRFRKKKALDCGKARCQLCSFEKNFGVASYKDRVRDLRWRTSLQDYFDSSTKDR
jgi:hypothetical protein